MTDSERRQSLLQPVSDGHKHSQVPPFAIMGGLHLTGLTEAIIPETIADMEQFGLQIFAPGHCTGWRAISAMERTFKDKVVPLAVGKRFLV